MMRALAPILSKNRGGTMVNVLSVVNLANFPALGSYSTLKAGLYYLTHKEGGRGARTGFTENACIDNVSGTHRYGYGKRFSYG
jgi:NAD(P)-dependent dehydrogenase (short-subunit alcohol dehydrogenase family)